MKTNSKNNGTLPKPLLVKRTNFNDSFFLRFMEGKTVRAVAQVFGGLLTYEGRPEHGDGEVTDLERFKGIILDAHEQGLGVLTLT
jgi:hypothetical protein